MNLEKRKTFPLAVNQAWLDRLGKAVNLSKETSKHDFLIKAAEKEMERVERESVRK